jgi:hypothetical protein
MYALSCTRILIYEAFQVPFLSPTSRSQSSPPVTVIFFFWGGGGGGRGIYDKQKILYFKFQNYG